MTQKISCILFVAASVFALSGCSGTLVVTDKGGKAMNGIPVRLTELWVQTSQFNKHSEGGECAAAPKDKFISLASGEPYYISAKGAEFAKTSLAVKLTAEGTLSEVAFDTESKAPEAMEAAASLLGALPIGAAGAGAPDRTRACDAGEKILKIVPFEEWRRANQ